MNRHGHVDLAILKLYPGANGWTARQYAALKNDYAMGFYFSDSTPSWDKAKAVIEGDLGLKVSEHFVSMDLYEFATKAGLSVPADLKSIMADMKQDTVGTNYMSSSVWEKYPDGFGATVKWVANYNAAAGKPGVPFDLHQFAAFHDSDGAWGDRSYSPLSLDDFLALTTKQAPTPPSEDDMTPDQASQLQELVDWKETIGDKLPGFQYGVQEGYQDQPLKDFKGPDAKAGWIIGRKAAIDEATVGPVKTA